MICVKFNGIVEVEMILLFVTWALLIDEARSKEKEYRRGKMLSNNSTIYVDSCEFQ